MKNLKVLTVMNDQNAFESDVNGWCCNADYKILSCESQFIQGQSIGDYSIMYIAFLVKE